MTIRKAGCPKGKGKLVSKSGKNLSKCLGKQALAKREKQVNFFKNKGK